MTTLPAPVFPPACLDLADRLLAQCRARQLRLALAESCTGGLLSACLTELPGASAVLDRAIVAYDNRAKIELLGVPEALLIEAGAVSEPVARAMAEGARQRAAVDLALAVTGVTGPGGGTAAKPVGLVHLAAASRTETRHRALQLTGGRGAIRLASVAAALELGLRLLD